VAELEDEVGPVDETEAARYSAMLATDTWASSWIAAAALA